MGAFLSQGSGRRWKTRLRGSAHWLFVGSELRHVGKGAWWRREQLLRFLQDTYCGGIGFEAGHLVCGDERRWWYRAAERGLVCWTEPPLARRRQLLRSLLRTSLFTDFMKTKFPTSKFFGLDGLESLIPGLFRLCHQSASHGLEGVELGLAHRGRLSIQASLLGKSVGLICAEMEEKSSDFHVGDVKYHTGFEGTLHGGCDQEGHDRSHLRLRIMPNPSHLEAVGPAVLGRVRAMQDALGGGLEAQKRIMGLVVHGDAAFSGLGLPFECMNLARLDGYGTGGTIHVVLNNQIGFTTEPHDGRSTLHPSDVAKAMDVPVVHVNADDVEAVDHAFCMAADWRAEFGRDVVIDLVGYRRFGDRIGHNGLDMPEVTSPMSYARVREHPKVLALYGQKLVQAGAVTEEEIAAMKRELQDEFEAQYAEMEVHRQSGVEWLRDNYGGSATLWGRKEPIEAPRQPTGVPLETLCRILVACTTAPDGFALHPHVQSLLEKRRRIAQGHGARVDFATAEILAFASIMLHRDVWAPNSGTGSWHVSPFRLLAHRNIRLSGQDSERGTFNQRHAVIHDQSTGAEWVPLSSMAPGQQAQFQVFSSPLSEMAVVAFEYGYSVTDAQTLVCWEAQFGDFANNAQVAIDQFIVSGQEKWGQGTGMVLLLPHGYDGQGPDHSSARLERFLQLVNDDPDHLPGTSPKEIRDMEQAFDVLNKSSNGLLSKDEVLEYLFVLEGADLKESRTAEEVWSELTSEFRDADRGIDRAQWRQIMTAWLRKHAEERINLFVVNVSTPAQYFHCLRRQAHLPYKKPLVVMAPKYLLHHSKATSAIEDFGPGQFFRQVIVDYNPLTSEYAGLGDNTRHRAVLKDGTPVMESPANVRRLIICSGQMYYTLSNARQARKIKDVALMRLEQIAPFPHDRMTEAISFYPNAEVFWCQEEPKNMGAWFYVRPRLQTALQQVFASEGRRVEVQYVGRSVAAVTASGSPHIHQLEQRRIVDAAFAS